MESKSIELIKNTIIIFLGKFCTQFISLLLLVIYTFFLTTEEYGVIDLLQTYILLLVPLISLRLDSVFFRFILDVRGNAEKEREIITNGVFLTLISITLFFIVFICLNLFINIPYKFWFFLNIIVLILSNNFMQLCRGVGRNLEYSISCIIIGITNILLVLVCFYLLKIKGVAILVSTAIANIFCVFYLFFKLKIYQYINFKKISTKSVKKILLYSLPMIPDGLSWWVVSVSDRSIINIFLGASANGIYAVSSKFSNILSSLFSVINMSWQESASKYIDSEDRNEFFSKIFNNIMELTFSFCVLLINIMFVVFEFFIDKEFENAKLYVPILLIANIVNAVTILQGGILIAKFNTKDAARTTIIGAIVNFIINLILVPKLELFAASISTLISYCVIAIDRHLKIKKDIKLKIEKKKFIMLSFILIISLIVYYINISIIKNVTLIFTTFILIILNKNYIKQIRKIFGEKFKKMKGR